MKNKKRLTIISIVAFLVLIIIVAVILFSCHARNTEEPDDKPSNSKKSGKKGIVLAEGADSLYDLYLKLCDYGNGKKKSKFDKICDEKLSQVYISRSSSLHAFTASMTFEETYTFMSVLEEITKEYLAKYDNNPLTLSAMPEGLTELLFSKHPEYKNKLSENTDDIVHLAQMLYGSQNSQDGNYNLAVINGMNFLDSSSEITPVSEDKFTAERISDKTQIDTTNLSDKLYDFIWFSKSSDNLDYSVHAIAVEFENRYYLIQISYSISANSPVIFQ